LSAQNNFEQERIEALKSLNVLDTMPEQIFDDITYLASVICNTPIALISLIDEKRQFFKSHFGLEVSETPREISFCSHAILNPEKHFVVKNAFEDERFKNNPLVIGDPNIAFYYGIPIVSEQGYPYGTLCVIDNVPRGLNDMQLDALKRLSSQVENIFEIRKQTNLLREFYHSLLNYSKDMEEFSYMVAHDLKGPTKMVAALVKLLQEKYKVSWDEDDIEILDGIEVGSKRMEKLIDSMIKYGEMLNNETVFEPLQLKDLLDDLIYQFKSNYPLLEIKYEIEDFPVLELPKVLLHILFQNLISNAIKYRRKEIDLVIKVGYELKNNKNTFVFSDNGIGFSESEYDNIFKPFKRLLQNDSEGHGLGLAFCKKILNSIGGTITVSSKVNEGTTFYITIPNQLKSL
jgi:signal transduction histidine kinase